MTSSLIELSSQGDTRIEWDKNNKEETSAAKEHFNKLVKGKKYLAYRTRADGSRAEQIRTFDPDAERIICQPQTVGG